MKRKKLFIARSCESAQAKDAAGYNFMKAGMWVYFYRAKIVTLR